MWWTMIQVHLLIYLQMGEIEPEMDTSALTQADQDMANMHSQQVQAMSCTIDQPDIGANVYTKQLCNQHDASPKLQPLMANQPLIVSSKNVSGNDQTTNLRILVPRMVNKYTQTMGDNHPPPGVFPVTGSATLPCAQVTAPSFDRPPRSFSVSSDAVVLKTQTEPSESSCTCSMCEMTRKELEDKERKLATEKGKSTTMKNILKEELQLKSSKHLLHEPFSEPRRRVFSVPARKNESIKS